MNDRLLDIIIPHWTEPWEDGKKMFDSLAAQRRVDLGQILVILVEDGEENQVFPEIAKAGYPYEIIGHVIPHAGVSAARNHGLENSTAKWVMFCDFDDCFPNIYSLHSIMKLLETDDYDMLWSPFYVETDSMVDIRKDLNWLFIHAKIFRREWIMEHSIRFPVGLSYAEDTVFCRLCEMEIAPERLGKITGEVIPYVWTLRKDSVSMDPSGVFKRGVMLFRRQGIVAEECLKRGRAAIHDGLCTRAMCDAYITLLREDITEDRSEFEEEVRRFWRKKHSRMDTSVGMMETAWSGAIREGMAPRELREIDGFMRWLNQIAKEEADNNGI